MIAQGHIDLGDRKNPDFVSWTSGVDKVGNEYFIIARAGYPPCVRRQLPDREDLIRAYKNDSVL
jgi:hypothetical protein